MSQTQGEIPKPLESKQYIVVASVMTVMFLAAIDNMITSTILPSVISSIGGLSLYPWVASIFMLTSTITLPLYGKLSDVYGHKNFTLIAIAIFLVGSALCGVAQNMIQLIIFRAIQGMGAGGLITMSFIMFGLIYPKEQRAKMQALLTAMWAIASIIGPVLGTLFVEVLTWRWAFYINIPFGLVSAWLIATFFKIPHDYHVKHAMDYKGVALFTASSFLLLYSLLRIGQGIVSITEISLLVAGILSTIYLVIHERKVPEPILPVSQFSDKIFTACVLINFVAASCLFSSINFMPLFIQGVLGGSARTVGQVLMAMSLGWSLGSTFCGRSLNKISLRKLVLFGCISMSLGLGCLNFINETSSYWLISLYEVFLGIGMGILATGTLVTVQTTAPKSSIGSVTSGVQLFRSIGGTFGISILGGLQVGFLKRELENQMAGNPSSPMAALASEPQRILDPISRASLPPEVMHNLAGFLAMSIHNVFFIAFIISLLSLSLAFLLPKSNLMELINQGK